MASQASQTGRGRLAERLWVTYADVRAENTYTDVPQDGARSVVVAVVSVVGTRNLGELQAWRDGSRAPTTAIKQIPTYLPTLAAAFKPKLRALTHAQSVVFMFFASFAPVSPFCVATLIFWIFDVLYSIAYSPSISSPVMFPLSNTPN